MVRSLPAIAVGAFALSGLAACSGSEESYRTNYRAMALANCHRSAGPDTVAQLREQGTSVDRLCTCAIDRYMRGATLEQLKQDRNTAVPPALRNTSIQCLAEQVQSSGGTPPGAAPAADAARAEADRAINETQAEIENVMRDLQ